MMVIFAVTLVAVGGLSLLAGLWWCLWRFLFLRTAVSTGGKVVGWEFHEVNDPDGSDHSYYLPLIEFEDNTGTTHRVTGSSCGSWRICPLGQAVSVLFNPKNPKQAVIGTDDEYLCGPIASTIFDLLALWGGWNLGRDFGAW